MAYTYHRWKGKELKGRTGSRTRDIRTLQEYIRTVYGSPATSAHFLYQVELVRRSWSLLKPLRTEAITHEMYESMLESDVDAVSVFRDNLDVRLGVMHHKMGVSPQHYQSMQRAIMTSLRRQLSHEWTQEYEDAWSEVWAFVSHVMISGGCQGKISRGTCNGAEVSQCCGSSMEPDMNHGCVTGSTRSIRKLM